MAPPQDKLRQAVLHLEILKGVAAAEMLRIERAMYQRREVTRSDDALDSIEYHARAARRLLT